MSFIERHKAWILPMLGVLAAGVVYLNLQVLGGKGSQGSVGGQVQGSPAAAPVPVAPVPPPGPPASARPSGPDVWRDLKELETPPAPLTRNAEILRSASRRVDAEGGAPLRFHPEAWRSLPDPQPILPTSAKATGPAPGPLAQAPAPEVAFIADTARGLEAWIAGRPYRLGDTLPDGHRVAGLTPWRVLLQGPDGAQQRRTLELTPRSRMKPEVP